MRSHSLTILLICFGALAAWAAPVQEVDRTPYVTWKDAEVLIWSTAGEQPFPTSEFCLALRRANTGIGNPTCREAGDWQRDSAANLYAAWLRNNLFTDTRTSLLRARSPLVSAKLRGLVDQMLLFTTVRNDTLWTVLFEGESSEPKTIGYSLATADPISRADAVAQAWFSGPAERRLTAAERQSAAQAPDPFYGEKPSYDSWAGIAYGYSQAQIPLTPASWYHNTLASRIKNYRNVRDSLSAWNFITDDSPLLSLYGGATFFGFIGFELSGRYTQHTAKIDPTDAIYAELDHWDFNRYEFALSFHLTRAYALPYQLETQPHFSMGFLYSVLSEDIALRSGLTASEPYKNRVQFESFYRGGMASIGNRLVFRKKIALDLRTGFASRGRSLDREPSPDAVAEPTLIGGATFDGFVQAGLEYHWQW